jgi:hypothetical protein
MLSLGVRISFVQKISASSEFRSIRADFFRKNSISSPPCVELCPEKHQETRISRGLSVASQTKEAVWQSQQSAQRRLRPGEVGILHRDENPVRTDRQRVHHFRPRNTRRDSRHRA